MATAVQALSWAERLRAVGLRVTQPRLAVLDVVHADPHLTADQVAERVRAGIGAVSTQAIYDALNTLTEHNILRRFEPAGSAMRFEVATGDNHHHLVCRTCGSVSDVPCAVGSMPCAIPENTHGYEVEEAEVTYWGTCPSCARARPSTTTR
jgi:Fe2+ or Zn2+ uptake regulation protein